MRKNKLGIVMVAAFCASLAACVSGGADTALADDRSRQADQLLHSILEADTGPGVMAAVVKNGELVWSGAAGVADLENGSAMTADKRLRIGSVSKPLTAILALSMVQAGAFDIDADISQYVSEFSAPDATITPRQLGAHTSGIRHFDFANYSEANNMVYRQSLAETVEAFANDPLLSAPGDAFHYSSHGFNLLGAALERAGGASFATLFEDYVAKMIAIQNTRTDHPFDIIEKRSGFYTVTIANPVFPWMQDGAVINTIFRDSSDYYPSGGMLSSASDLASFTYKVFVSDFLSAEMKSIITNAATLNNGAPVAVEGGNGTIFYSFGWELRKNSDGDIVSFGHNGETNGAYALIRYFPEDDIAIAGIANYNILGSEPYFFKAIAEELPALFRD